MFSFFFASRSGRWIDLSFSPPFELSPLALAECQCQKLSCPTLTSGLKVCYDGGQSVYSWPNEASKLAPTDHSFVVEVKQTGL